MILLLELISLTNVSGESTTEKNKLHIEVQQLLLAFDVTISNEIRAEPNREIEMLISAIDHIKAVTRKANIDSEDLVDKASAKQVTSAPNSNSKSAKEPIGHIFISYSHQTTLRAMQLRDLLKEQGFPVWFDAQAIKGNSVEAMVLGLNDARLVIMCLSDGYRQSDFCKREAEYTVLKKGPFSR